ncbi:hypothetical protein [Streptomyces sp. HD]|uniref:hypothetical protein n=1 Tax=Streptomyces sp. HD TaxID=3020892 RepID=UPI00232B27EB|nr:hypothetical protein [Streptomyces sp. HD]MDC0770282.1 hypothetical protein [Streptomyces sp. HD]
MIGRQKIATVTGLLGALAVIYSGAAAPAYADGDSKGACTITTQGDIVCIKKSEKVIKDKRGYAIKQAQDCEVTEHPRVAFDGRLANDESERSGPVVECSNSTHLPKGVKVPKFKFKF